MDGTATSSNQLTDEQRESLSKRVLEYENEISLSEGARDRIINVNQIDSIESSKSEAYASMQEKVERRGIIQTTSPRRASSSRCSVSCRRGRRGLPEQVRRAAENDPLVRQTKSSLSSSSPRTARLRNPDSASTTRAVCGSSLRSMARAELDIHLDHAVAL